MFRQRTEADDAAMLDGAEQCPLCGVYHQPEMPHALTGLFERNFTQQHGRAPQFADTLAHCGPAVQQAWQQIQQAQVYYACFQATYRVGRRGMRDRNGQRLRDLSDLMIAEAEGRWP
jgi:hypothetical protein